MIWQDLVITISVILFSYALLPQIYQGFKNKKGHINLQTSAITMLGMYAIAITYLTLNLVFSSVMCFITGTMWLILLTQKVIYK